MHHMGERSSVDSAISLSVTAVGGVQLFRLVQRLRHRATHPDMEDPRKDLARQLQLVAIGLAAATAIATGGLVTWLGPVAVLLAIVVGLVAIVAGFAIALWLWLAAERRRRALRYVICEDDYSDAPRQIKSTMRRIYRSAQSVRTSQAHQRNMFGDLSLDEVVYRAAERAILSSELAAAARDLRPDAKSSDQTLLDEANDQIRAIKDELAAVEATFKRSAEIAEDLSQRVTEPDRSRATENARQDAAFEARERGERARTRLEEISMRVNTATTLQPDFVGDRIDSVAAGYYEATKVSDQVLDGPSETINRSSDAQLPTTDGTRDAAMKAARLTSGVAKWTGATAKSTAEKFRKS